MKKIVYIMSSNYSGSHFLSLIIGSHSHFQHIGEIKWLRKDKTKDSRVLCGICGGHEDCPVFSGISAGKIDNVYEDIFSNVGPEIFGLVDTSKKTFWAERFLQDQRYEKKFIHLIRDPRALVRRWFLDEERSLLQERIKLMKSSLRNLKVALSGDKLDVYVGKWLRQNLKIADFISQNRLDAFTVTYHDLVKHEDQTLAKLMQWLGCEYEPGQADYWNFTHHGSTKSEYEWVNQKKTKHFDCRWKDSLNSEQRERVINHKEIVGFLQQTGINIAEDGLTAY
ncbi:MAG: hypothetical protein KAU27_07315 [Desulfuromonadales bacterium]|nr:hypothetical protein [Desulfuromonadales bacterium]